MKGKLAENCVKTWRITLQNILEVIQDSARYA